MSGQYPQFIEGPASRTEAGVPVRTFHVVLPGFEASGIFKAIRITGGRLQMEPADGEQLHFRPVDKPTTSFVMLVRDGEIAPELLRR
jgi:hypothetical protein